MRATTTVTAGGLGAGMTQFVQGSLLYDPASRGVAFASGPSVERAGLSGRVFLDQNGDGRWSPDEALLSGVRLRAGYVTAVSDSSGRVVGSASGTRSAGIHELQWSVFEAGDGEAGKNSAPPLAPGSYTVRLVVGGTSQSRTLEVLADRWFRAP